MGGVGVQRSISPGERAAGAFIARFQRELSLCQRWRQDVRFCAISPGSLTRRTGRGTSNCTSGRSQSCDVSPQLGASAKAVRKPNSSASGACKY